jgi:hypothetical protein
MDVKVGIEGKGTRKRAIDKKTTEEGGQREAVKSFECNPPGSSHARVLEGEGRPGRYCPGDVVLLTQGTAAGKGDVRNCPPTVAVLSTAEALPLRIEHPLELELELESEISGRAQPSDSDDEERKTKTLMGLALECSKYATLLS